MYMRRTRDVWELYVDYGQGYEYETAEYSLEAINRRRKDYALNCPQYPTKVIKKRERITERS